MKLRTILLFTAAALATACDRDDARPSAEQDRELNGAAEMLDDAENSLANVDDSGLASNQAEQEN